MRIARKDSFPHFNFFAFFILLCILVLPSDAQERFRKSPPLPEPFPELSLPQIETHTLSNGLGLAVVRRQNQPIISMRLIILTGESSSPDNLPGLASLCARMITKGSVNLKTDDVEEKIESIGGSIAVRIHPDYTEFVFSFLEDYLDDALQLLGEILLRPTFPRLEIGNVQRSMFYDLAIQAGNPEFIARRLLSRLYSNPIRTEKSFLIREASKI